MRPLRGTPLHPQWFMFRNQRQDRQWVHERAEGRVLDVGCADGWAREVLSHCQYVGLDYPTTALKLYMTRPQVYADGAYLPFSTGTFDTVLLLEVLEHVSNPERVLAEISRVLKPGGAILISVPFLYPLHDAPHDYRRYTAPGLIHMLTNAGLEPGPAVSRNAGAKTVALLAAIFCGEFVVEAMRTQRWRLLFAPIAVVAIPLINLIGWVCALPGAGQLLASGHAVEARKP